MDKNGSSKRKSGRPIEYPDSPMHYYWRKLQQEYRARKKAEDSSDSAPGEEAVLEAEKERGEG